MSSQVYDSYIKMKSLTPEEEREYFRLYREENNEIAKKLLIEGQLSWIARAVRRKYPNVSGFMLDDLLQEGGMHLLMVISDTRFDYTKNIRFQTYARGAIIGAVGTAYNKLISPESAPKEAYSGSKLLKEIKDRLAEELGREPTIDELHQEYNNQTGKPTTKKTIISMLGLKEQNVPLTYINSEGEETEREIVDDSVEERKERLFWTELITDEFLDACGLTKLQKLVLINYFGLFGLEPKKLPMIAAILNRSKTACSNSLTKAKEKVEIGLKMIENNKSLTSTAIKERANKSNKESVKIVLEFLKTLSNDELIVLFDETLTEKEKDYIIRRFGFFGTQKQSIADISQELGVSRPSVYEPINKGIAKLLKKIRK